ncbi:hypothetical protein [Actinoplanes sp. NPDC049316]|uniref:hypothetical protein n=1 Tax=Actinoplanes sp. NPDC049316 TaxID=3154727 RepID=UPI003422EA1E
MWATAIRDYIDLRGDDTDAMLAITAGLGFHELHQGLVDGTPTATRSAAACSTFRSARVRQAALWHR